MLQIKRYIRVVTKCDLENSCVSYKF